MRAPTAYVHRFHDQGVACRGRQFDEVHGQLNAVAGSRVEGGIGHRRGGHHNDTRGDRGGRARQEPGEVARPGRRPAEQRRRTEVGDTNTQDGGRQQ